MSRADRLHDISWQTPPELWTGPFETLKAGTSAHGPQMLLERLVNFHSTVHTKRSEENNISPLPNFSKEALDLEFM